MTTTTRQAADRLERQQARDALVDALVRDAPGGARRAAEKSLAGGRMRSGCSL
jgi:hypothetical protein